MSVLVLASGAPPADVMLEARGVAAALKTPLVVLATADCAVFADEVVVVTGLDAFSVDRWLATFVPLVRDAQVLFMADGAHARAVLPQLALRVGVPLITGVTRVREGLLVERPLHQGLQTERLVVTPPLFVTMQSSGVIEKAARATAMRHVAAVATAPRDTVLRLIPADADTVELGAADKIVAGGFGLGSQAAVAMLGRLGKQLGAAVGGTRVISDRGWLEHDRYIGSTGKTVAPKLYLALGISGASQHLVGITSSENIVAINTDRAAPIFGVADLGIVGDLHAIVPELEARLAKEPT